MNAVTTLPTTRLAVRLGASRELIGVNNLQEASRAWTYLRDKHSLGASQSPKVTVIDCITLNPIATISYNGRIWDMRGNEIC